MLTAANTILPVAGTEPRFPPTVPELLRYLSLAAAAAAATAASFTVSVVSNCSASDFLLFLELGRRLVTSPAPSKPKEDAAFCLRNTLDSS